jgi:hypothetical protein
VELTVAATLEGSIICDGVALRLDEVRSIYLRPYDPNTVARQVTPPGSWTVEQALVLLADAGAIIAVNRPSAMASNASKPFQLDLIRRHGFSTPETDSLHRSGLCARLLAATRARHIQIHERRSQHRLATP